MASKAIIHKVTWAALLCAAVPVAAQDTQNIDLGGGLEIAISEDWNVRQFENPAMNSPAIREAVEESLESRLSTDETSVMVTFIHFKSDDDDEEQADMAPILAQAMSGYLASAQEMEVKVEEANRPPLRMAWGTLAARDGESFRIATNMPGGCVTTVLIANNSAVHTISIGSQSCDAASHAEALEAITGTGSVQTDDLADDLADDLGGDLGDD